jgi:hypothetical protein
LKIKLPLSPERPAHGKDIAMLFTREGAKVVIADLNRLAVPLSCWFTAYGATPSHLTLP